MNKKAQVVTVGLSLFAAVSAGYVAGRRALDRVPTTTVKEVVSDLPDPRQVLPNVRSTDVVVATAEVKDVDRLNALQAQLGLQVWKLSVLPAHRADMMHYRLVVREKGKPDVELQSAGIGLSSLPPRKADKPLPIVVSLLPQGGSLSGAKKLSLRISTDGSSVGAESDNPFAGSNSWGSVDSNPDANTAAKAPGGPVEFPLMEARADAQKPGEKYHVRVLILTVRSS